MRNTIITIVMLIAAAAQAQWTNVWPAWNYPREQNEQIRQCYSAAVERCAAVNTNNPTAPTWYRLNRTILVNLKTKLKAIIPTYTTNETVNANGDVSFLSATGLCVLLTIPTNYFDYTPYRGISGLGGNTNDTTVGRPYGYTNASTVAGGPYLPAGRATWYDTDYGIDPIRLVVNMLTNSLSSGSIAENNSEYWWGYSWDGDIYESSWISATNHANTLYQLSSTPGWTHAYGKAAYRAVWGGIVYAIFQRAGLWYANFGNRATNITSQNALYLFATNGPIWDGMVTYHTSMVFNAWNGPAGLTNGRYVYIETVTTTTNAILLSPIYGATNQPSMAWSQPEINEDVHYEGYSVEGARSLNWWTLDTNGFKYK